MLPPCAVGNAVPLMLDAAAQGRVLMLNDRIHNVTDLERALLNAERRLKPYADDVRADLRAVIPSITCRLKRQRHHR